MKTKCISRLFPAAAALLAVSAVVFFIITNLTIRLEPLGTYRTGIFDKSAAEITAYDPKTKRVFVTNVAARGIDILDISRPQEPKLFKRIDLSGFGSHANSVTVINGIIAVAVENIISTDPGLVVFFDADGNFLNKLAVGAMPDMLTFTPDGKYLLVANEGEPNKDYTIDPEGSVSMISVPADRSRVAGLTDKDVTTLSFAPFNEKPRDPKIRIFGPHATLARDLEPEYITVSPDSRRAWVTLQENNAVAVIDLAARTVTGLFALGAKDHRTSPLDASDQDGRINITGWPVKGLYLPDGIAAFAHRGRTYLVTANEGDSRDYAGFSEEKRVKDLTLDPGAFPQAAALQQDDALGRLTVTTVNGDSDGDGDYDALYAFGGRSFSIWTGEGKQIFDSADEFERIIADQFPRNFNSNNSQNHSFDKRSDNKGPEPETVVIGRIFSKQYAFIALERMSGIMVYDITNPRRPRFVQYMSNRDFSGDPEKDSAGDLGEEGLIFVKAHDSPIHSPLLIAANEVSGSVTIYRIHPAFYRPKPAAIF